jgi:peroxiredoxin-like protein
MTDATREQVHSFTADVEWSGSTADGYEAYNRDHRGLLGRSPDALDLSAGEAFRGERTRVNPEEMLVGAASSCQLLSFLAVAARARIDVHEYVDHAVGTMDMDDHPARVGRIELRPRIVVAPGPSEERVRELCETAHRHCFVANSLLTEIAVEPEIVFAGG